MGGEALFWIWLLCKVPSKYRNEKSKRQYLRSQKATVFIFIPVFAGDLKIFQLLPPYAPVFFTYVDNSSLNNWGQHLHAFWKPSDTSGTSTVERTVPHDEEEGFPKKKEPSEFGQDIFIRQVRAVSVSFFWERGQSQEEKLSKSASFLREPNSVFFFVKRGRM